MYKKKLSLTRFRWVYLLSAIIIIGSVMSFGLIGSLVFRMDEKSSIFMLVMIPLMMIFVSSGLYFVIRDVKKKTDILVDGIHAVAAGNLNVKLELNKAQEFEDVYSEFNTMVKELSQTKKEMDRFVDEFAHEFKTPIASISGFAEYLIETGTGIENEERMEYLHVMNDQAKRLLKLSQNTLLLSKMEAMEIVTGQQNFDIGEQIRHCAISLIPQFDEKKIELDISDTLELPYYGNPEITEHIWINLLGNAVKFTPEGGIVSVSGHSCGSEITVVITDTGSGMSEESMKHIFERYYQYDSFSLTKGNGIGLALVKRIVDLCGGAIHVTSVLNQGSTFTVNLPVMSVH